MNGDETETLWEHIESYDGGEGLWGSIKTYMVLGLYLSFFFVAIPLIITLPLARGLGLDEGIGYILFFPAVWVIWRAGKSVRFKKR